MLAIDACYSSAHDEDGILVECWKKESKVCHQIARIKVSLH